MAKKRYKEKDPIEKMIEDSQRKERRDLDRLQNMEYNAADDKQLQRMVKPVRAKDDDLYDMKRYGKDIRRKYKSFPAFCRDFIGQNEGAIARAMLDLYNSQNPADRITFLKFIIEFGKQGYPSSMAVDPDEAKNETRDMYAQLAAMSQKGIAPPIGKEKEIVDEEPTEEVDDLSDEYTDDYSNEPDFVTNAPMQVEEVEVEDLGVSGYEE